MNNNFEFIDDDDLFLLKNGELELRFLGDSNNPYFYLPFQLWLFEKQMTGDDCFKNYRGKHHEEINEKYRDMFYRINNHYIPARKNLPAEESGFNLMLSKVGLSYLSIIDPHKIILEQNNAVIKRLSQEENNENPWFELIRYTSEDIHSISIAYRTCMLNSHSEIIKNIYEEITYQTYKARNSHVIKRHNSSNHSL
jgi:hypothetical protein